MMERPACSHDCDLSFSMYQNYDMAVYVPFIHAICAKMCENHAKINRIKYCKMDCITNMYENGSCESCATTLKHPADVTGLLDVGCEEGLLCRLTDVRPGLC